MRQRIGVFVVAAVTLLALLASGVALAARDAPSVDDRMREIAAGLRCPVCQN
ncbi:MAG TPA: cytochrome C biogenesis protein CcdA, partial [Candidatus Rokubacteria bacterium]|nr:cytochrome C biogenesis protein CcdA [Candidatus Rokubacteria bacterium]